ncbi:TetR/AcrR family transcriptional regulator [Lysinibacillus piscis]|uniref:TetR family transcriptional regulator n=1 Tax=Lysinibacillus piscis TaxID=2518931 RepID=A0ABQ5NNV0_9BACI|nr:TetR/AcrR family transcriptional regulator [Lysinibacillus sp. KH24]GLC89793.1 TetR family transcriptional regulator [Lysinibacillus sp. KH24]
MNKRIQQKMATRDKILRIAQEVFSEYGFQDTTITLIIERAEIGYGTVYGHFKNKDEILSTLIEQTMSAFFEVAHMSFQPKSEQEAIAIISTQVEQFLTLAREYKQSLQLIHEAMRYSDLIRQKWAEIVQDFVANIAQDIAYSKTQAFIKANVDAEIIAQAWFAINETFLWNIVHNDQLSITHIAEQITQFYISALY